MNERGQGMSISTIILLILGIIILVVLVIGFSVGWNKVLPFVSTNNVNSIDTQCSTACTTNGQYDFCSVQRDLSTGVTTLKNVTCNYLAQKQTSYNVAPCSSISCSNIILLDNPDPTNNNAQYTAANFNAQTNPCSANSGYKGNILQTLISNSLYSVQC